MTGGSLRALLRCVECAEEDALVETREVGREELRCGHGHVFPVVDGIPRLVRRELRDILLGQVRASDPATRAVKRTADSFGYEWSHFAALRPEWERNFLDYMSPRGPKDFAGKLVLDAGCGTGRHAYHAARFGARVLAVDLGPAIEVAHRNTAAFADVLAVQADLGDLPVPSGTFDLAYSLGVLHHLPDPEKALRELVRAVRPGGEVTIYVYWRRRGRIGRALLGVVTAARRVTTRLPHRLLHVCAYPIAVGSYALFVLPARALALVPGLRAWARSLPLAGYMQYPLMVLVNDQFDRFSAPIERRYSQEEVRNWLTREGLENVEVRANYGWIAMGRKPGTGQIPVTR